MIIDALKKEIQIKIVYYGPALSGKTTSLKSLFKNFEKEQNVLSLDSTMNRTLFFDYGTIQFHNQDWFLKIHIYSTTGQDFYMVTRPITLKAVDGIIMVVDSQKDALDRNFFSWNELKTYFKEELTTLPTVICFNKQDLTDKFSPQTFLEEINYSDLKNAEKKYTIATKGEGILESFEEILSLIFKELYTSKLLAVLNS